MIDFTDKLELLQAANETKEVFNAYRKAYRYAKRAMQLHEANITALQATLTTEQLALVEQGRVWANQQITLAEQNFWQFLDLPNPEEPAIEE